MSGFKTVLRKCTILLSNGIATDVLEALCGSISGLETIVHSYSYTRYILFSLGEVESALNTDSGSLRWA